MTTIYLDRATREVSAIPLGSWRTSAVIELPRHQHTPGPGEPIEWVDADSWLQAMKSDLQHIQHSILAGDFQDENGRIWLNSDFPALDDAVEAGVDLIWRDAEGGYHELTAADAKQIRDGMRNWRVMLSQVRTRKEREAEIAARTGRMDAFDPLEGW